MSGRPTTSRGVPRPSPDEMSDYISPSERSQVGKTRPGLDSPEEEVGTVPSYQVQVQSFENGTKTNFEDKKKKIIEDLKYLQGRMGELKKSMMNDIGMSILQQQSKSVIKDIMEQSIAKRGQAMAKRGQAMAKRGQEIVEEGQRLQKGVK